MRSRHLFRSFLHYGLLILLLIGAGCKRDGAIDDIPSSKPVDSPAIKLQSVPASETGIHFENKISDEGRINIFTWHFIYNGAGVAVGDINNDGLPDIYFSGNQVADKLYLNKGDFRFEDITSNAGIGTQTWSSGVTMADVNADGLMDIYVCKNSPTGNPDLNRNKLYINQGKNVFREQAHQYGLDDIGFSTQATFFDADQDGDLDMYLVNQPFDEFARLVNKPEVVANYPATDRFFFFENGKFVDKIASMGLMDDRYGLNASLGDFDFNGWTDLYICNDYHHGDRLLLNFKGTFKESIHTHTGHTSFYSMGSDVGDINNDGWMDLFTLDMAYEDHYRSKTNMGSMDVDWFWSLVRDGHHYQYMQNVMLINQGHGYFSDMAQIAGVAKSDWSFATLLADLDLDADQDILITNGVLRDMRNNDFNKMVRDKYKNMVGPDNYLDVLRNLPSTPIANVMYSNDGDMHFTRLSPDAGFSELGFSHGLAYADFDKDGKLDIVINNENAPASIYKNVTATKGHYLKLELQGPGNNKNGLGCSAIVYTGTTKQANTMQTTRGYFSGVEPALYFGLGDATQIDSIQILWDHKSMTVLKNIKADQTLEVHYLKERKIPFVAPSTDHVKATSVMLADVRHVEVPFDDYRDQVLLPYKMSQNGPYLSVGDINGDQIQDLFLGGAAGYAGTLLQQNSTGVQKSNQPALSTDKNAEDMESAFFDADQDGDQDLLVVSGSNEFQDLDPSLQPRLYINDGKGKLNRSANNQIPEVKINAQCLETFDVDGDQDMDVFIGGRMVGGKYAVPANSYLWINDAGQFRDVTQANADFLENFGMVTDAIADDVDQDGDQDLMVVGEWMAPTLLRNDGRGKFSQQSIEEAGSGLWWTIEKGDFDQDGDADFILGNLGWNNKFNGSKQTKLEVYSADFDKSGDNDVVLASEKKEGLLPVRGRECTSEEMPFILDKFPTYDAYAKAALNDIYSTDQLNQSAHHKLSTMTSILLRNEGGGKFASIHLPLACQAGIVKAFYVDDVNGDQLPDFIYAGNHFPTEVETARYDGLYPGVCYGDGKGNFTCKTIFFDGELQVLDVRDIRKVLMGSKPVYVFAVNDGPLKAFTIP